MADLTRNKNRFRAQEKRVFSTRLTYDEVLVTGVANEVVVLPKNVIVTSAFATIITPFAIAGADTGVLDVGVVGATDDLLDGGNLKAAAGTTIEGGAGSVVPKLLPTGGAILVTPVYSGALPTAGEVLLVVEYLEYERYNGEQTNFLES